MQTPVGTAWYTAPEVYRSEYTEKCDIWSAGNRYLFLWLHIGVMLYVMLVGFPPFYGETDYEVRLEVLRNNFDF